MNEAPPIEKCFPEYDPNAALLAVSKSMTRATHCRDCGEAFKRNQRVTFVVSFVPSMTSDGTVTEDGKMELDLAHLRCSDLQAYLERP